MGEPSRPKLIIFTDLDGTLLDLGTYSYLPALEALGRVISGGVPLVFCSSKTGVEQRYYQERMGIRGVMIVENGSAILIPQNQFSEHYPSSGTTAGHDIIELGESADRIRSELADVRRETGVQFRGFKEISLEELCSLTDLAADAAARAQAREYSETIVGDMPVADLETLGGALQSRGLSCIRGSRFHTVVSSKVDKGKAVRLVTKRFRHEIGDICTAGIGDSGNDEPMLGEVDRPYLLQRPDGTWEKMRIDRLRRVEGSGPASWNRLVCNLLDEEWSHSCVNTSSRPQ